MRKIENISNYFIITIFSFIMLYLTGISFGITTYMYEGEISAFLKDNIALNLLSVIMVLVFSYVLYNKNVKVSNKFVKIYVIVVNIIILWFVLSTQFASKHDQSIVMDMAGALIHGNYEYWKFGGYAYRCVHQNGITLIFALISLVFGPGNDLVIQLLNVLFMFGGYYYMYKICKKFFLKENVANIILLVLYSFVPYLFYVTFEYGTVIGFMFIFCGFYHALLFMEKLGFKEAAIAGIMCGIAVVCKSNFYIFVIALVLMLLVSIFSNFFNKDTKNAIRKLIFAVGIIIICFAGNIFVKVVISNVTGETVTKGTPASVYIAMGLQDGMKAPGWNNGFDHTLMAYNDYDYTAADMEAKRYISKAIDDFSSNPSSMKSFFTLKLASMWTNPTFQWTYLLDDRESVGEIPKLIVNIIEPGSMINKSFTKIFDVFQTLLYFGALLYCILGFRKIRDNRFKSWELLFALAFIGTFIFHIFWEAKCYYSVIGMVLIIPYAVAGFYEAVRTIDLIKVKKMGIMTYPSLRFNVVWLIVVVVFFLLGLTVSYVSYKIIPFETYETKYNDYLVESAYNTNVDGKIYKIMPYSNEKLILDIATNETEGTKLVLNSDINRNGGFRFVCSKNKLGKNNYFIEETNSKMFVYLRDITTVYKSSVYLQSFSTDKKSLVEIEFKEDYCYIINPYGYALTYISDENQVIWDIYSESDNQKWNLDVLNTND